MAEDPAFPRPPQPVNPQECCQRGCDPCILDYYDRAMERWENRIIAMGHDPAEVLKRWNASSPPSA